MFRRALGAPFVALAAVSLIGATIGVADGVTTKSAAGTATTSASVGVRGAIVSKTHNGVTKTFNPNAGPPYHFTTELMGEHRFIPLKDSVMLTRTGLGYRFRSGGQNSHLTVSIVNGKLRFRDPGTQKYTKLAPQCKRNRVKVGVSADCSIPNDISVRLPLLVEIWPRIGNDWSDTSSLPATFAATVLGDVGLDTAYFGAGPDFFNGHTGNDRIYGGGGKDWIRGGKGNDLYLAGPGDDELPAGPGRDRVHGGDGDDRVGGAEGNDLLWGDGGVDFILCGPGRDHVVADSSDRLFHDCE